jgi:NADH-quinone oxidoreductase subunit J
MDPVTFGFLAALLTAAALGVILQRSPVRSALSLVVTLFLLAVVYLFLDAQLVAALQIIVYAGAIMVLFLFVIMLLNLQEDRPAMVRFGLRVGAAFAASLFFLSTLRFFLAPQQAGPGGGMRGAVPAAFGSTEAVAEELFTRFLLAFEVTGVLLLVAIIGAVVLAKRKIA